MTISAAECRSEFRPSPRTFHIFSSLFASCLPLTAAVKVHLVSHFLIGQAEHIDPKPAMASTLPSPPASRSTSPDEDTKHDDLTRRLDELLEQHLELLDQYTTLREELSKTFSAGFFSLAQAQRASALGAGRRYGKDCYDERMKAQRRVHIKHDESRTTSYVISKPNLPQKTEHQDSKQTDVQSTKDDHENEETMEQEKPLADTTTQSSEIHPTKKLPKQDPALRDPLTWFGILAPPTLRQTQSHFVKVVEHAIPALLGVDSEMRALEQEISTVRERLGISLIEEEGDLEQGMESGEPVKDRNIDVTGKQQQEVSKAPKRTNIASRPVHSRSPLLKLGD